MDNPYLFNAKGPRQKIDYSSVAIGDDDDMLLYDYATDENAGGVGTQVETDGSYRVVH